MLPHVVYATRPHAADDLGGFHQRILAGELVFAADGLSAESVQELNLMANALWAHVLQAVMAKAVPLCDRDVNHTAPQRFRLGLFTFSAPEFKPENTGDQAP